MTNLALRIVLSNKILTEYHPSPLTNCKSCSFNHLDRILHGLVGFLAWGLEVVLV